MKHIVKFLALLVSICLLDRSSWDSDPTFLCLVGEKFILYYLCCSGWRPLVVFTFSKFWLNVSSCYFPVASIFHCVTWDAMAFWWLGLVCFIFMGLSQKAFTIRTLFERIFYIDLYLFEFFLFNVQSSFAKF